MVILVGCGEANAPPAESSPTTAESVAALEKLGAKLKRNGQGEIVMVGLVMVSLPNTPDVTQVTDADLVHLKGLTNLELLSVGGTLLTDAGGSAQVTDAGLVHLKGLTNLTNLILPYHTQVTDAGVAELKKALPNCDINR